MREIKFRGMNTKGEWVYGSLVTTTHGIAKMPHTRTKTWIIEAAFGNGGWFNVTRKQYVRPETVGQFTGLQDSNGIDIYEGDIVEDEDHYYSVISWDNDDSMYVVGDVGGLSDLYHPSEIIGNIHENPELKP